MTDRSKQENPPVSDNSQSDEGRLTLREVSENAEDYSDRTSQAFRPLVMTGIAVVWLFKVGDENAGGVAWDVVLAWSLGFFTLALVADLLHYVAGTLFWLGLYKKLEKPDADMDAKVVVPHWINWPTYTFFFLKIAFLIVGYVVLLRHIFLALFP